MNAMLQEGPGVERNPDEEARERERYVLLEQLYLLTGTDCETTVDPEELRAELGPSPVEDPRVIDDLVRLGYARTIGADGRICLTLDGLEYLQQGAWRRRSVRD
jgi:hypothetical protein